jgi:ribosomal protein S19
MVGSIVGVYNGKTFNQVEVKVQEKFLCHFVKGLLVV